MPVPSIPRDFKPLITGYSFEGTSGVLQTKVAGGSDRFGRQYRRSSQLFKVSMNMRPAKLSVWTNFYFLLIDEGATKFTMGIDSGQGLQDHVCNIVPNSYSAVRAPNSQITVVSFVVSAVATVWNNTKEDAQAIVDFWDAYGEQSTGLLDLLERFANVDTRVLDFI